MSNVVSLSSDAAAAFRERFGESGSAHVGWSPGRVNLIGEYMDLNNGFAMPMAIDLGVCVVLRTNTTGDVRGYSMAFDEAAEFRLDDVALERIPGWARYLAGVALLSRERGCDVGGFDAVVHGDLPIGGGVSSSAALSIAMTMALESAASWSIDALSAAKMCQEVEHRFAGVMCGIMDQLACRTGQPEHAVLIDCASLETSAVPVKSELASFLIVDSGVPRSLHQSEYNARRTECLAAVEAINALGHPIADLRGLTAAMLAEVGSSIEPHLARRCRHVVTENERVLSAHAALTHDRLSDFGGLMNASHASLRDDFEVSIEELDSIVSLANEIDGVLGARLTGAGFGGNAIVLARPDAAVGAREAIVGGFAARYGREPRVHRIGSTTPAQGGPSLPLR